MAADTHALRAQIALDQRDWARASQEARAALAGSRDDARAWYALGRTHKELGNPDAAIACYRRALLHESANPEVLTSLATALYLQGAAGTARRIYRDVLARNPGHGGASASLAAIASRAPRSAEQLFAEGLRLNAAGRQPESLEVFEEAASLDPSMAPAIEAARRLSIGAGLLDKARHYTERLLARTPRDDLLLALALCVSAIPASRDDIGHARRDYERRLDEALARGLRGSNLAAAHVCAPFFLAFHGANDAALQRKAATLISQAFPHLVTVAPHCLAVQRRPGRIRIGFVSGFLSSHSIGMTSRGLIAGLDRQRFEVYSLHLPPAQRDAVNAAIRRASDQALDIDPDVRRAQQQIAALELDVLFFQDIGMEPLSYRLALSRLAPVQCVSYGHPDTTGIANLDYFISNDLYEPEGAQSHYTERLFELHDLPTLAYYYRPTAPEPVPDRSIFGLHPADHVYLCPQSLFKLHPEFDLLLGAILARDPSGVIVLLGAQYDDHTQQVSERLRRSLGDGVQRILILDRMPYARYMQLLSIGDVCLDTIYFNGMNTSLEALSTGLPVVTLPGPLQRSRHTQAMLRKLGVADCIARSPQSYVDIAVRLACDPALARATRARIRERAGVLYEDPRVLREFERFFVAALREKRPECMAHADETAH